jgi:gas vesicle protein
MIHENQEYRYPTNNTVGVLAGLLIGGLADAVTMLLLAPRSGKDTRKQVQEKNRELRDRTTELVEDTVAQVHSKPNKITVGLKDRGQDRRLRLRNWTIYLTLRKPGRKQSRVPKACPEGYRHEHEIEWKHSVAVTAILAG